MFIQCFDCMFIYDGQMERIVKYTELQDHISLQTVLTEQGTYEESKTQLENAVWAQTALCSAGWDAGSNSSLM